MAKCSARADDTTLVIGLGQMNSKDNTEENLASAELLIEKLAAEGAQLIMLPEHFNFLGPESVLREHAETIEKSISLERIRRCAEKHKLYIHLGSFLEKDGEQIFNTGIIFNPAGEIIAKYRKIHLFDVSVPGGKVFLESETISPGNEVVTFTIGEFVFGMATCYDLRFPELFRRLVLKGANVLLLPAAFTLETGREHWQLLLRARAVENLCWVAATGQWGKFLPDRTSFGRSMVIDPWGVVTAQAPDGVTAITATLNLASVRKIRRSFPALEHMRQDLL